MSAPERKEEKTEKRWEEQAKERREREGGGGGRERGEAGWTTPLLQTRQHKRPPSASHASSAARPSFEWKPIPAQCAASPAAGPAGWHAVTFGVGDEGHSEEKSTCVSPNTLAHMHAA